MVCPCCGGEMAADNLSCSCGARVVGPPLVEPDNIVPALGRPLIALALACISLIAFIWKGLLVVTVISLYLAIKAIKLSKKDSRHFGGIRIATTAFMLSTIILLGVSIYIGVGIPKYLKLRTESQQAATRAQMYHIASALHEYKMEHGIYPANLDVLQIELKPVESVDLWENPLKYQVTSEVAAVDGQMGEHQPVVLPSLNQYQLVSPGPDGKLGTIDDLVMSNDIIISPHKLSISADEEPTEE